MWWVSFINKTTYTDAYGKSMDAYRIGTENINIMILPPEKDLGDFLFQSYPAHFFTYYWFSKILGIKGKYAILIPASSSMLWEIYEEKVLKTSPISIGDIIFGILGGMFSGALPDDIYVEYRFTPSRKAKVSYPNTGNPSLDTLIYKLNTNYTPFSITLRKVSGLWSYYVSFAYSYGDGDYPYDYPYKPDSIPSILISTETFIFTDLMRTVPLVPNSPTITLGFLKTF